MGDYRTEKACGGIIVKNKTALLILQQNGFWGFPKGHVEAGESEEETAIREIFEETGLIVTVDSSKRFEFSYNIKDSKIHKVVTLFISEVVDESRFKKQDAEIKEMRWVPFDEVEKTLTYPEWKEVWKAARKTL